MVSKKARGDKHEKEVVKILEDRGYVVQPAMRQFRFIGKGKIISKDNDMYNLFDGVAKDGKRNIWYQVKTGYANASGAKKGILDWAMNYTIPMERCEIWLRVPEKGFVVWSISNMSHINKCWHKWDWQTDFFDLKGNETDYFEYRDYKLKYKKRKK